MAAERDDDKPTDDCVQMAFLKMREMAQKRSAHLPDLHAAPQRPQPRSQNTAVNMRRRGRPTGRDGRAISYGSYSLESLGTILNKEISKRGWQPGMAKGWIMGNWDLLVGDQVAHHTRVEMLKDTTLFISCDSTAWTTNLRLMQKEILKAIAHKVGPDIVTELKIFGPKTPSWRHGPLHVKGRGPRDTYG
ncbi:DciA family protein [Corynebacterium sp. ES2794-CONJ1]|uniref:DciA family protein n=1 Tax=unclassified Corynebacterium TaxID=2624378 RepID=UPI002169DF94|nr:MULTISPECIES: DciA family protein [unclassified Corynebacterium]MCS4490450.1 DciA family protein [Corynebacterium sp. ES2775-CONJ]MCS4492230.1 DciA family protein [Corynebacterium sp. ES2715-CONJ3]MCS4532286.1 DciA family protein [Corynebacterium sp. ES2730-CONJ]MCU9519749.1 DciA family protein [Corynebacterium sp. ES2794-CONJ1]